MPTSFIRRKLDSELRKAAQETPVVALLGPRQSGKTTLARMVFKDHNYVNLEDLEQRRYALAEPKSFLDSIATPAGVILDEIQHVPELFSYIQVRADEEKKNGYFVLTGSQNFALDEKISQSLSGRISKFQLLPLSIQELVDAQQLPDTLEELVYKGCYPKIYSDDVSVDRMYKNYIQTYIEKDVRQIKNITNLLLFQDFIIACAARSGQLLNLTSLSEDLGISQNTVKSWLSVLVSSYIVFLVKPYRKKYGKQLVKAPKLFFVDSGLVCSLLGIKSPDEVKHSYLRGSLVETLIVSDLYKQFCNKDFDPSKSLYFWRDHSGHEIDAIIHKQPNPIAVEIKSGKSISPDYFSGFEKWNAFTKTPAATNYVIYGGQNNQKWQAGTILGWQSAGTLIDDLF
jgi:predicted AAA+ superfamily ATPase